MIEDILRRAQVRLTPYTTAQAMGDHARLMRRIREVKERRAAAHRSGIGDWLAPTSPELAALILQAADDSAMQEELTERIERDLMSLSRAVITAPGNATRLVEFLDADRPTDPVGARVLACLLYRRVDLDSARFWWRFAAGAGDATAAYCLFLEALLREELEEAVHCYRKYGADAFLADDDPPTRTLAPRASEATLPDVGTTISELDTGTHDGPIAIPASHPDLTETERAQFLCHR
ncbi:hypothetical protein RM780_10130 [Streptomyces sp. DSM 44917]|uniref:Uncharacterized protein n=1 Tax=Streptomyces boetiae TaxID=3075541 RepID=A0ABU2L728_9ACTN|nr:hypothetical protein [Streptomyces sp. DSM 44917]MDT0307320.1 hypothetical protein [Streptomyces sp. DSM 44917]